MADIITVHVTNLEKYLPGYKDRALSWFKVYFRNSLDGTDKFKSFFDDEVIEGLQEADRYRYLSLIAMEAQLGRPVPLDAKRLAVMGWNTKKRSISLTLIMLQGLVEVCNGDPEFTVRSRTVDKEEDKEEEKSKSSGTRARLPSLEAVISFCKDIKIPESDGEFYHLKWQGNGFTNGGRQIKDWKATIRSHQKAGYLPSQKGNNATRKSSGYQGFDSNKYPTIKSPGSTTGEA